MTTDNPVLVIGATGKTGARVAARLAAAGHPHRAVSRRSEPEFDWEKPETWAPALEGMKSAYITYVPDLAAPEAQENIRRFAELAKSAGLKKLVLLSGRGEHGAELSEENIRKSGLDFTIVRASWFNQNFDEGFFHSSILNGVVALPAGSRVEPFIDVDDIADVAVAALLEDKHNGETYEVTGPRLLTFADAAAEIAAASGLPVSYVPIDGPTFHAALLPAVGPGIADLMTNLCAEVFDGRNERLSDGVQRALGRPPRDFSDYVKAAAARGAWRKAA
ncbi:NAD(P)H-binding protein [Devosia sp.]|uniref:NAD(P)H-binding protein n=1 Tax=Devosia sp. TaxID=1871048 RepID=UPI0025EB7ADF|nr:NAD(P)H-binding protein [Devosia sp.]MCR6634824.1 NmrA family transcriptional regulator [Devosia sp.]